MPSARSILNQSFVISKKKDSNVKCSSDIVPMFEYLEQESLFMIQHVNSTKTEHETNAYYLPQNLTE